MTTAMLAAKLTEAHAALAAFRNGDRTPALGATLARIQDEQDQGLYALSEDTSEAIFDATTAIAADLRTQVDDLLNVLLDDAGLPTAEVSTTDALGDDEDYDDEDEFAAWGWPVCALVESTEETISAYADLFSDSPEAIADHLFFQLQDA